MTPSAFDIAGAVVATPLALMFWYAWIFDKMGSEAAFGLWVTVAFSLWSAFCIARILGAHL